MLQTFRRYNKVENKREEDADEHSKQFKLWKAKCHAQVSKLVPQEGLPGGIAHVEEPEKVDANADEETAKGAFKETDSKAAAAKEQGKKESAEKSDAEAAAEVESESKENDMESKENDKEMMS